MATSSPHRDAAVQIVRVLQEHGHVAYFAGGCVRDELLGLTPKDFDVATDAPPERVRELFRESRFVGEAFGVALVRPRGQPFSIEVATFRSDDSYSDGRRPDSVTFTDARHDAERRDFTINGLFENPLAADPSQRIIDYVGGQDDLRAGVIRAIGDPEKRFAEDYLRMLRAVRFAARFDFQIEPRTRAAVRGNARLLGQISRERIGGELRQMLAGGSARPALAARLAQELHLDGPALNEDHVNKPLTTLERLASALHASPAPRDAVDGFATALAAWMIDRHGEGSEAPVPPRVDTIITRWRKALCLSNEERDAMQGAMQALTDALQWGELSVAKRRRLLARPQWGAGLLLLGALDDRTVGRHRSLTVGAEAVSLTANPPGIAPPPLLTGEDLIAAGLSPGPRFKELLDTAYDAQLEGRLATRDAALQWLHEQR